MIIIMQIKNHLKNKTHNSFTFEIKLKRDSKKLSLLSVI